VAVNPEEAEKTTPLTPWSRRGMGSANGDGVHRGNAPEADNSYRISRQEFFCATQTNIINAILLSATSSKNPFPDNK